MAQSDVVKLLTKHKELTSAQMAKMTGVSSVSSSLKKMFDYREVVYTYKPNEKGLMVRYYRLAD